MIKVKETSKSGVIAEIDGVFGQLSQGVFVPYSEQQLETKTAYREEWGWREYASVEAYLVESRALNEARKQDREEMRARIEERRTKARAEVEAMIESGEPIPATIDNIGKLARYLNEQNWGGWTLPKMTIGYSAAQYDCDGVTATTITLDRPITDEDKGIFDERKFKVGGKRGHLEKYQRI